MSDSFDTTLRWEMPVPSQRTLAAPWRRQQQPVTASAATPAPVVVVGSAWEQKAIAILGRPIVNESAAAGHARKEAELKELFAALSVSESRALHARLVSPKDGDE